MKKHFILIIIFILFFPIVLLQNNFSKTNPYDPNWIYWDDTLLMDKSFYEATGDKWAYITYLNYLWTLRYNENVQGRDEQFLVKQETLDFVRNMILAADGDRFKSFFQSISSLVLHNEDVTLAIRKEYSDLVIDTLKQKNIQDEDSTKAQQYKKTFAKEFDFCKSENLPLQTYLSSLYWGIGSAERLYNHNYKRAFCSFLYAGISEERSAWYEQLMGIYGNLEDTKTLENFFDDFGERVKEYGVANIDLEQVRGEDGIVYINDNGKFARFIRGINNSIRANENNLILKEIMKHE